MSEPRIPPIFVQLKINLGLEDCEALEALAWIEGVALEDFLQKVLTSVARSREPVPSVPRATAGADRIIGASPRTPSGESVLGELRDLATTAAAKARALAENPTEETFNEFAALMKKLDGAEDTE